MAHLSLSLLGGFEVTLDVETVTAFGADKVRALLAFLAIDSAHAHRRAELSAMFWPDLPEKNAAHNLSQSLLRLRQALRDKDDTSRPPFLLVTPRDVQFNTLSDSQLDVSRFRDLIKQCDQHQHSDPTTCPECVQRLTQAAELYRGDLLSGLFVPDSIAFEEWRLVQQEELHALALAALSRLAAYYQQQEQWQLLQDTARRQIALEPWREEAHLQLMRALAYAGQTAAALRQFENYQRTLADELGLQPSAEVSQFYAQIRAGEIRPTDKPGTTGAEATWLDQQGERRQVTTLVCSRNLQGDPEEMQEQFAHCERQCAAIFHRFGGERALRQGFTCKIYFGYPQAYEDAARRAVHSALAVVQASENDHPVRIGIHTGEVLVGEQRGQKWQDRELMGHALELAVEYQRLAGPGEVVISTDTRHLVEQFFDIAPLKIGGQTVLDGAFRVSGESGTSSRLDWLARTRRLTLFTGRDSEIEKLRAAHEQLLHGQGQAVLLQGEAGIGKSRLLWEMRQELANAGEGQPCAHWLVSHCLPFDQNTSLYPVIGLLEQLFDFQAGESPEVRLQKLHATLERYELDRPANVWLLSLLLGLPTTTRAPETVKAEQREQMRKVFVALVQKRAAEGPLVLVIEDLHWADPSTVDWLGLSLVALTSVPCLLLFTARPTFHPDWLADSALQPRLLNLPIRPLRPEQSDTIVQDLAGEGKLNPALRQRIVSQTDGIPLFIEELTKSLLEQPGAGEHTTAMEIPATLRDSLVTRLDHLGMAKETAQWASVLGREFSYPLLQACVPFDEPRLRRDLARLVEAELIEPLHTSRQDPANERYAFKHGLMQNTAYTALLKRTRQVYHRRVSEAIESRFPRLAEARPEVLAQHLASAGLNRRAFEYWLRASERARAQGATLEARIFLDEALKIVEPGNSAQRWRALQGREKILAARGEREAQQSDLEALAELAEAQNDDTMRAYIYLRQTESVARRGDYSTTLALAEKAHAAARRAGAFSLEMHAQAYRIQTMTFFQDIENTRQIVDETLARINEIEDAAVRAQILASAAHFYLVVCDYVRAVQMLNECIEIAFQSGNYYLAIANNANLNMVYTMLGLFDRARASLVQGQERADQYGDQWVQAGNMRNLCFVYWCLRQIEPAKILAERALVQLNASEDAYGQAACHTYLGYIYEYSADLGRAAHHLRVACEIYTRIEMDTDRFEAQAVAARVALAQGHHADALRMALEVWDFIRSDHIREFAAASLVCGCIADVCTALKPAQPSPREVIELAYRDLMERADEINDPAWRQAFLNNVIENRDIVACWRALNP